MNGQNGIDRLFKIMNRWGDGVAPITIAEEFGLTRQRVHQILKSVNCTATLQKSVRSDRRDRTAKANAEEREEAKRALQHRRSRSLSGQQRGTLAWRAQGLGLTAIGRRLGISRKEVKALIASGLKATLGDGPDIGGSILDLPSQTMDNGLLGESITRIRRSLGLSRQQLARTLNIRSAALKRAEEGIERLDRPTSIMLQHLSRQSEPLFSHFDREERKRFVEDIVAATYRIVSDPDAFASVSQLAVTMEVDKIDVLSSLVVDNILPSHQ